jgi:hypothetical protein
MGDRPSLRVLPGGALSAEQVMDLVGAVADGLRHLGVEVDVEFEDYGGERLLVVRVVVPE